MPLPWSNLLVARCAQHLFPREYRRPKATVAYKAGNQKEKECGEEVGERVSDFRGQDLSKSQTMATVQRQSLCGAEQSTKVRLLEFINGTARRDALYYCYKSGCLEPGKLSIRNQLVAQIEVYLQLRLRLYCARDRSERLT